LDPARFVFLRNTPKDADWTDEANWFHANPALGSFLNIESLRNEAREAMENPAAQNAFRVFRLNQWVSQASRWLDMSLWDENGLKGGPVLEEHLEGRTCWGGLDLASVSDFTAWVLLFRGTPEDDTAPGFTVVPRFFVPRRSVERRKDMREKFEQWEADGFLTVTEGNTTDYQVVEDAIRADLERFRVQSIGFDPWNAPPLIQRLEGEGITAVKIPQSAARLNESCKALDVALARRQLAHGGNPILRWHADNVEAEFTPEGYMKPSKKNSADKIDGIAALVNALFVEQVPVEESGPVGFVSFDDIPTEGTNVESWGEYEASRQSHFFDDDDDW
jgi:phage terminase large subunit-like protein